MESSLEPAIVAVVKMVAGLPDSFEVSDEQRLHVDLGIDSVKLVEAVVRLEELLAVDLGDDFSANLTTVGELREYVTGLAQRR